jgi:hypothetical protein
MRDMTEILSIAVGRRRYNRRCYELKHKENLMNRKMWFVALALLCVQNALAIETPEGWQSGTGAESGETRYIPKDANERGVILIISGLHTNEENLPLTQYLEDMADKAIYDNPPGMGIAVLQRDKAKQNGDRAELSFKMTMLGAPVRFYITAYPVGKNQMRFIEFFIEDDTDLIQRYQGIANKMIEEQYVIDHAHKK